MWWEVDLLQNNNDRLMNKLSYALLFLFAVTVISCSDDDDTTTNSSGLNYSYFPVNTGHELIYDAVRIVRSTITGDDTAVFQVREVVESVFDDNQGRPTQRLERYIRNTPSDPWVIADVWTANMTASRVEKKEENTTFIKLIFPLKLNKTWNGNSLNNLGEQEYFYSWIDKPYSISTFAFDSTLRVVQADDSNYVYMLRNEEIFAAGVGLVYKNYVDITFDRTTNPGIVGVEEQVLYKETLISWSN
jgi:hypothetical protein